MEFVSLKKSTSLQPTSTTTIHEYMMTDPIINGAVADIQGRYPEKGFVVNTTSREIVYVIDGSGIVGLLDKEVSITVGDVLLLLPNEKYYWQGTLKLFMATTPRFDPAQHNITLS